MTHLYVWHDSSTCVTWLAHMCTWLIHMCAMTITVGTRAVMAAGVWGVSHLYVWHDSHTCVTCSIDMCDMTHSYVYMIHDDYCGHLRSHGRWCVWHDAFACVTWLIYLCDMSSLYVWHDAFICAVGLIHVCDMTHANVYTWRLLRVPAQLWAMVCVLQCVAVICNELQCGTVSCSELQWVVVCCRSCSVLPSVMIAVMCATTHSCVCHDSFMCVPWLIRMCDMIYTCEMVHSYVSI